MVELPENRQPLLGTEEHASSRPSTNVTIKRQLELCGASRVQGHRWVAEGGRALPEWAGRRHLRAGIDADVADPRERRRRALMFVGAGETFR